MAKKRKEGEEEVLSPDEALARVLGERGEGSILSKEPPQSLEAEQATLGAMMMEREATRRAMGVVEPQDFYSAQHRQLCGVIYGLFRDEEPVDLVTVQAKLQDSGELVDVGGLPYLLDLQEASPTAAAVNHYARIVRKHSVRRTQIRVARSLVMSLHKQTDEDLHRAALTAALALSSDDEQDWVDLDALLAMEIEVEWLVDPIIPLGGITIFLGDLERRKSFLAQSLFHALARGCKKWLGYFPLLRSGGALYIDGEKSEAAAKGRMEQLDAGMGLPADAGPAAWDEEEAIKPPSAGQFNFGRRVELGPQIGMLEGRIRELRARLVVFDSVTGLAPAALSVYKPEFWQRAMPPLNKLARKTHCSMVLVHHLRGINPGGDNSLAGRAFGGMSVFRAVDSAIGVEGEKGAERIVVKHIRGGLTPKREPNFWVDFRPGPNGSGITALHGGFAPDQETEGRQRVKEILREFTADGHDHRRKELLAVVKEAIKEETDETPSNKLIDNALREMVNAKEFDKPRDGSYRLCADRKEEAAWE